MDSELLTITNEKMDKALKALDDRFATVRAGRANPNMLDDVMVSYYGVLTPVRQLATVSIPEARQLNIKPFDRSILNDIEKAIFEANLGVTPNNNGEMIFITIPALTEERRKELVKQVKELSEDAKISIRNIRHDIIDLIKVKEIPEDQEKSSMNHLQDIVNDYNKKIEDKLKEKEKELLTV